MSPLQRSKAMLEKQGWHVEIVEHWNPWAKVRKDLFGFADLLCLADGAWPLLVQVTSRSNVSARVKKIKESPLLPIVSRNFVVVVHGWGKLKRGWDCKIVEI